MLTRNPKYWLSGAVLAMALGSVQAGNSIHARDAQPFDIEHALIIAFEQNPELAAAGREIGIAQGGRRQAGLIPNPTLSWESEGLKKRETTGTLLLSQPIELGGKRRARIQVAEQARNAAGVGLELKRNALAATVIAAFYEALRAQARLDLAQQSSELGERGMRVAQGRVDAGKSAPLEATRAQIQLEAIRLELNEARRLCSKAIRQLTVALGGEQPPGDRLQGDPARFPPRPELETLLAQLDQSAALRLAALQIDQGEAALALEKSHRIADLNVNLGTQYQGAEGHQVGVLGVSMPLPLFNRNQGNVYAATQRADQARDLRNATELRLRAETQQAIEQWSNAQISVEAYQLRILPAAQKTVDTALRGFQMGKFAFLDVLDAQRTLIASRNQYLQALAEVGDAWVQIVGIYGDATAAH